MSKRKILAFASAILFVIFLVLVPLEASAAFRDLPMQEQIMKTWRQLKKIKQVVNVESGEIGGDSLLRTRVGDGCGENIGLGSSCYGWRAGEMSTGSGNFFGAKAGWWTTSYGNDVFGNFALDAEGFDGDQNTVFGSGGMGRARHGSNNTISGNGAVHFATTVWRTVASGLCVGCSADEVHTSVLLGEDNASNITGVIRDLTSVGQGASRNANGIGGVHIGKNAAANEAEPNKLHIANNADESLIEGSFADKWVKVNGDFEAERVIVDSVILFIEDDILKVELADGTVKTVVLED